MPGHKLNNHTIVIGHTIIDSCPYCKDKFPTYTVLYQPKHMDYYTCEECKAQWVTMDTRQVRLDNLKKVVKQKQNKVVLPGYKKGQMPEQYAILYAGRGEKIFDVIHMVNEVDTYKAMLGWEIYGQAVVYDLDQGEIIEHQTKVCHCHPL